MTPVRAHSSPVGMGGGPSAEALDEANASSMDAICEFGGLRLETRRWTVSEHLTVREPGGRDGPSGQRGLSRGGAPRGLGNSAPEADNSSMPLSSRRVACDYG
ncbi:unnamed protein product [Cutaneotrichosporon oleaginosum]